MSIRILLADDHEIVRQGLRALLEQKGYQVVGEAANGHDALKLAAKTKPDVAVFDLTMPLLNGLDATHEMASLLPKTPVILLTMHSEEQYARRAFKAGAAGFITKDSPRAELSKAIHKVMDGGKYLSPALAEKLIVDLERGDDRTPDQTLSDREFQVMRLIASGKTLSEIADLLSLSDKTISETLFGG